MPAYISFKFKGDITALTPAAAQDIVQSFVQADSENERRFQGVWQAYNRLLNQAVDVYSEKSRQVKYLHQNTPERPTSHKKARQKFERDWSNELFRREQNAKARERRQRAAELTEVLEDIGYEEGNHFHRSNAITFAKRNLVRTESGELVPMLPDETKGEA